MKNNKLLFLILLLISAIMATGCSKDKDKEDVKEVEIIEVPEPPSDPEPSEPPQNVGDFYKSFIGQWQEIARGNDHYPELTSEPSGVIMEFFEDGTAFYYSSPIIAYRADAEFLYMGSGRAPDGRAYRHTFTGVDTLRLDYAAGLIAMSMYTPSFYIYKRIK
jgi:hypothetical protein